ncbi:hypothetical protein DSUL_260005 [Desulfovibrionales bacterium]
MPPIRYQRPGYQNQCLHSLSDTYIRLNSPPDPHCLSCAKYIVKNFHLIFLKLIPNDSL